MQSVNSDNSKTIGKYVIKQTLRKDPNEKWKNKVVFDPVQNLYAEMRILKINEVAIRD